jgi:ABC transporter, substrate-binding protein
MAWNPDVLITGKSQSEVEKIMSDPAWSELKAVKIKEFIPIQRGLLRVI